MLSEERKQFIEAHFDEINQSRPQAHRYHVRTLLSHVYWSFDIDGSTQTLTTEEFNYFMELKNQKDLERLQGVKSSKHRSGS